MTLLDNNLLTSNYNKLTSDKSYSYKLLLHSSIILRRIEESAKLQNYKGDSRTLLLRNKID